MPIPWPLDLPAGQAGGHGETRTERRPGCKSSALSGAVKLKGLIEGENARAGADYIPFMQTPLACHRLCDPDRPAMRRGAPAVRAPCRQIDPEMQPYDVFTSERVEKSLKPRRAPMMLALAFGRIALLPRLPGLYGVLAYQVDPAHARDPHPHRAWPATAPAF